MLQSLLYYHRVVSFRGVLTAIYGKLTKRATQMKFERNDWDHPFILRIPSTDVPTYGTIFETNEYGFEVSRPPQVIVDAGANIGLASLIFANQFPEATIISIEPEKENFELLCKNVAPYKNVIPIHAALWDKSGTIDVLDSGHGQWAFITRDPDDRKGSMDDNLMHQITCISVPDLIRRFNIEKIDILKLDVEGAEREIFNSSSSWIDRVEAIIIELHDRLKPGCSRAFYTHTPGFDYEWLKGENIYLTRKSSCINPETPKWKSVFD